MNILFLSILATLSTSTTEHMTLAKQIADFLNADVTRPLSLEMLCDEFHYSKNYIINQFKTEYGMTPITYINELRLHKAMHLMEKTSTPVERIILDSGFATYAHFYRLFRRETGLSPVEWRKRKRIQPLE